MYKKFTFLLLFFVFMSFGIVHEVLAQSTSTPSSKTTAIKVSLKNEAVPKKDAVLTPAELRRFTENPEIDVYGIFNGDFYDAKEFNLTKMSFEEALDKVGQATVDHLSLLKNFALRMGKAPYTVSAGILTSNEDACAEMRKIIAGPIKGGSAELVNASGLTGRVDVHDGIIDALWGKNVGFNGIELMGKLDHLRQEVDLYYMNGDPVDFPHVTSWGDLNGAQTRDITKIYALAFFDSVGNYVVLGDSHFEDSPIMTNGMRKVNLTPMVSALNFKETTKMLQYPPFCLRVEDVKHLFINNYKEGGNYVARGY